MWIPMSIRTPRNSLPKTPLLDSIDRIDFRNNKEGRRIRPILLATLKDAIKVIKSSKTSTLDFQQDVEWFQSTNIHAPFSLYIIATYLEYDFATLQKEAKEIITARTMHF